MGNSLHDQLLKAGLVTTHQVRVAKTKKQKRQKNKNKQNEVNTIEESAKKAAKKEKVRVQKLNQQKKEKADRKANLAQIKQLIEKNPEPNKKPDVEFNFADGHKIKRLSVTALVQKKLTAGQVAIVAFIDEQYALVPREIADKIALRDQSYVIFCNELKTDDNDKNEDEYPDHQVPDDLIW